MHSVVGAGIARTYYSFQIVQNARDVTWFGLPLFFWIFIEGKVAVICASAPALKVFIVRFVARPISTFVKPSKGKITTRSGGFERDDTGGGRSSSAGQAPIPKNHLGTVYHPFKTNWFGKTFKGTKFVDSKFEYTDTATISTDIIKDGHYVTRQYHEFQNMGSQDKPHRTLKHLG